MPIVPNALERLYVLRLNRSPGATLDMFASGAFDALGVAIEIGAIDALYEEPATVSVLAERLDADADGLARLLALLDSADYVTADGEEYRLTSLSRRWVASESTDSLGPFFRFWREVVLPFCHEHATTAVLEGAPPETMYEWLDDNPEKWPLAQRAFEAATRSVSDDFVAAVDPQPDERVLDLGGGHARFSIECCLAAPGVTATVVDDPAAFDAAVENVERAGLGDRVSLVGGDYFEDDLGDGYDVALACNILHAHNERACREFLDRVHDALAPGGRVAVLDQFDSGGPLPLARTATRVVDYVYLATLGGRVHDEEAVRSWLSDSGFESVDAHEFRTAGSTLLLAEKA
ncbi:O-methyltransferase [Halobacterium sp. DL1]|jgi:SAM-dependent methyltransferase|nr:O-methyltransferase [Halobacterium sp. DL1]